MPPVSHTHVLDRIQHATAPLDGGIAYVSFTRDTKHHGTLTPRAGNRFPNVSEFQVSALNSIVSVYASMEGTARSELFLRFSYDGAGHDSAVSDAILAIISGSEILCES